MKFVMKLKQILGLALACAALTPGILTAQEAPKTEPGLVVTFTADGASDTTVFQNVWLYAENGKPVTPFLNPGKFTATWDGFIAVDLRDNYTFKAEVNGTLKVEVNTNVVLEATVANGVTEPGKRARLNKGLNPVKVTFTSPDSGDAYLRLQWSTADFAFEPLPVGVLSHTPGAAGLVKATQLRQGRELFIENRCVRCHTGPSAASLPDLALDAPDFKGIGSRRNFEWLAQWIENPKGSRALAQMPKMVHGATAKADAEAMAAYLVSLKDSATAGSEPAAGLAEKGGKLFENLHCVACHVSPNDD
jgi:mono/diheme cytochrome c family protein